jgi:hypothetical protein
LRRDNQEAKNSFGESNGLPIVPLVTPCSSPFYNIHTESIRIKRQYLALSSSQSKYQLENFPNLREPEEFALRMNVLSEELKKQMLGYTEQPLPTSLTKIPPSWSAIATFIFTNHVRGLERNLFTHNEILLQQLIQLGQQCVLLRDEIYLQIIKQLRGNPDQHSCKRLWKLLCVCLYHFPPSKTLESYLELFLIQGCEPPPPPPPPEPSAVPEKKINRGIVTKINNTITVNTALNSTTPSVADIDPCVFVPFARCAVRCLHQTIFFHGYNTVIDSATWLTATNVFSLQNQVKQGTLYDSSSLKPWFSDEFYLKFFESYKDKGDTAKQLVEIHTQELWGNMKSSRLDWDSSKATKFEFPVIDLTIDPAFNSPITDGFNSHPLPGRLRGTREDWIARFTAFHGNFPQDQSQLSSTSVSMSLSSKGNRSNAASITSATGSNLSVIVMSRSKFCNAIASTLNTSKSKVNKSDGHGKGNMIETIDMDYFDRDILYFILLGKRMSGRSHVVRELRADVDAFHFNNKDDLATSKLRRHWIERNFSMTEFSSELFFSQLQTTDLIMYAERFWDNVVARLVRESDELPNRDKDNNTSEVVIGWEIYRELILTGMKKYLELFQVIKPSEVNDKLT